MLEADLYLPVKLHLEACGYTVRGEVAHCDIVGWDEANATVIAVELKRDFGLPVLYQALRRLALVDLVYVGVQTPEGARARSNWDARLSDAIRLCRLLGLGLLSVRHDAVTVHADPGPFTPRKSPSRRERLLGEFHRRSGDHNVGGTSRQPRMTAYREDALRCARILSESNAPMRPAALSVRAGVPKAGLMLRRNVHGWFEKLGPGLYGVTAAGRAALVQFAAVLAAQDAVSLAGSTPGLCVSPQQRARAPRARPPTPVNRPAPPLEGPAT